MIGIVVLSLSFLIAIIGLITSNKTDDSNHSFLGLKYVGWVLIVIATLGFVAGTLKELSAINSNNMSASKQGDMFQLLAEVHQKIVGHSPKIADSKVRTELIHKIEQATSSQPTLGVSISDQFSAKIFLSPRLAIWFANIGGIVLYLCALFAVSAFVFGCSSIYMILQHGLML